MPWVIEFKRLKERFSRGIKKKQTVREMRRMALELEVREV